MSQAHGWFYFHDRASRGGKLAPALPAVAAAILAALVAAPRGLSRRGGHEVGGYP